MRDKELRKKILNSVELNWPAHIKEIVKNLGYEINNSNIKKVSYHIRQLEKDEKIKLKRIGQALVVWPIDMEKLRVIYEILRE